MRKPSMINFTPARGIPWYFDLYNFKWVGEYVRYLDKKKQIPPLQQEKKKIETSLPDKAEFLRRLKESHNNLLKRQGENLRQFIIGQYQQKDPLYLYNQWYRTGDQFSHIQVPAWSDLEEACVDINFSGTISEKDRAKSLSAIENKLADLEKELVKLCPKKYCDWIDGRVELDQRKRFVDHWKSLQSQVNAAINPTGMKLATSPEKEQKAHFELGLEKLVYSMAPFMPHSGAGVKESDIVPVPVNDTSRPRKEDIPVRQGQAKSGRKVLSPGIAL